MGRLSIHPPLDRDHLMPRIRELERKGLTQERIAVEVGVAQSTVQKWLWDGHDRRKKGNRHETV